MSRLLTVAPALTVFVLAFATLSVPACRGQSSGQSPPGASAAGQGAAVDAWDRALAAHQRAGGMDYAGLQRDPEDLDHFLGSLDGARPAKLGDRAALAFWINAYNAVVVHHVLQRYPGIRSVQDVDGFFDTLTFPVAGKPMTLDEIESAGREIGDPRIHFAVVCASTSCPDLRSEAYVAERLDDQLDDQVHRFLSNETKGLRYDADDDTVWLSSIFKWYAGDFTGGSTVVAFFARGGVLDWVLDHAPEQIARALKAGDPSVRYLDYDWSLNDR
jgi:hypothetical protein